MISCAEARVEFVALDRGEVSDAVEREVLFHLGRCAACAAERDELRRTEELVRLHVQPEVSADARLRLASALTAELARSRRRRALRRLVPYLVLPFAAAAGVTLAVWTGPGAGPAAGDGAAATPDGDRAARAAHKAGELGGPALAGVSRGLAWLAAHQRTDGTWAAGESSDVTTTMAATASALLAFAADGQSPRRGPLAPALRRADEQLARLVDGDLPQDADAKPLYALCLGLRALTATYVLDRDAMTTEERRERRELVAVAGHRLVDWQNEDGGFGYAPRHSRSDASCTLFAAAALADVRDAGVLDAGGALGRAGRFLGGLRGRDGGLAYMRAGDRRATPALTAALVALGSDLGLADPGQAALASLERSLGAGGDTLLSWCGAEALARHGRRLETPVRTLLSTQREDGAFPAAADRSCGAGGDTLTTAFGVLGLAQVAAR